jgi:hypothetical protein
MTLRESIMDKYQEIDYNGSGDNMSISNKTPKQ